MSSKTSAPASLTNPPEIVEVATRKVACDGVGGALGHPKVWYDMSEQVYPECNYCDRVFAHKGGSHDPSPAGK